jgi:hypothetical protein
MRDDLALIKELLKGIVPGAEEIDPNGAVSQSHGRKSVPRGSAPRNRFELWHRAAQRRQSASTFALDQSLQCFSQQGRALSQVGKFLGEAKLLIIKDNGGTHAQSISS